MYICLTVASQAWADDVASCLNQRTCDVRMFFILHEEVEHSFTLIKTFLNNPVNDEINKYLPEWPAYQSGCRTVDHLAFFCD
jgi:hypothetical protein